MMYHPMAFSLVCFDLTYPSFTSLIANSRALAKWNVLIDVTPGSLLKKSILVLMPASLVVVGKLIRMGRHAKSLDTFRSRDVLGKSFSVNGIET